MIQFINQVNHFFFFDSVMKKVFQHILFCSFFKKIKLIKKCFVFTFSVINKQFRNTTNNTYENKQREKTIVRSANCIKSILQAKTDTQTRLQSIWIMKNLGFDFSTVKMKNFVIKKSIFFPFFCLNKYFVCFICCTAA